MSLDIDVSGVGKWELAFVATAAAGPDKVRFRSRYNRLIEPFDIPIIFDTHVLAVAASYGAAPHTWFNCADLVHIATGATIDDPEIWNETTGAEAIVIERKRLRLNQSLELFVFQQASTDLRLTMSPMPWIPEFSFGIYAFRGDATIALEEKLDSARAQLVTIEAKIDSLL